MRTYLTAIEGPQIQAGSWAEAENKAQELGVNVVSDIEADLYVAQQTFAQARNVLMASAGKAKKHCIVLYSDSDKSHSAMASGTDINDAGIQSCISSLLGWLPVPLTPELEKSLVEVLQRKTP